MTCVNSFELQFTRVLIHMDLAGSKPVSRFPEATLRGGFGTALKRLVCITRAQTCENCMLSTSCAYAFLFETPPPQTAPRLKKYRAVPHPFVMRAVQQGSSLAVELTLFGNALGYLAYFVYTLNKLGESGLGKQKVQFKVRDVLWGEKTVYPLPNGEIDSDITPEILTIAPGEPKNGTMELHFTSPLVLRREGRIINFFDTHTFFATLLRRCTNLNAFFGMDKEKMIDPAAYLSSVSGLEAENSMSLMKRTRYSTRQKKTLDYSGITGKVVLTGEIGKLLPLLRAGEIIGVGKNTVFGGGVYRVREIRDIEKEDGTETGVLL